MESEKNTVDRAIEIEDRIKELELLIEVKSIWIPYAAWTNQTEDEMMQEIEEAESEIQDLLREYRG